MLLAFSSIRYGTGKHQHSLDVNSINHVLHFVFFFYDMYVWGLVMIKTSLAFMLFRFHQERAWRIALYAMLVVQVLVACASTITNYLRCTPLSAAWNLSVSRDHCFDADTIRVWTYVICCMFLFSLLYSIRLL
jgi:hypothetical protein